MARTIRNWREICEEVLRERNQDHINTLLEELLDALEERELTRDKLKMPPSDTGSASNPTPEN